MPNTLKALPRFHVRRLEARKILGGIAERTFAQLEAEGVIVPLRRGRGRRPSVYDLRVIVPAYLDYTSKSRVVSDREARAMRDRSLAELNDLRIKREKGQLIPRQQVIAEGQAYTKAWTAMIRALPRRMAQAGLVNGHQAQVEGFCRDILSEISRWRTVADLEPLLDNDEASAS